MPTELPPLYVFAARFNPLRWKVPEAHYRDWVTHILDSGAHLVVAEVQTGDRPFTADLPGVRHIGLRARTSAWSKEGALNEAVRRTPEAELIAWGDTDVWHRNPNWVDDTRHELQRYKVVQTWTQALDLGPDGEVMQTHRSFCDCVRHGLQVIPGSSVKWKWQGGPYDYPHPGYFWAAQRGFFDAAGGLIDVAAMGSGDHHMALGLVGAIDMSWPGGTGGAYKGHLLRWQQRAIQYVNGRIGAVRGTVEHRFHGSKGNRGYQGRWEMFVRHGFDPDTDLIRNSYGVVEWAGNKPELEREWDAYLRARREDDNFV